ncbi:hypothetical protein [Streptomyces sp. NPDC057403]|uniref:hypothetical protein n=1 Tax=Streptomyces sp. NPDC057403 TaxID=3346119 RepID=UPI0036A59051
MARFAGIRKKIANRRTYDESATTARSDRPSRLTDIVIALLLATADALAISGIALIMTLAGMVAAGDGMPDGQRPHAGISFSGLALVWMIPAALAISTFVHASLRMPVTAVVQGLFFIVGLALALAETNMLLAVA